MDFVRTLSRKNKIIKLAFCDQIGIDNYFKKFFSFGKFPHIIEYCKYIFT